MPRVIIGMCVILWLFLVYFTVRGVVKYINSANASDSLSKNAKKAPHGFNWDAFAHVARANRVSDISLLFRSITIAPFRFGLFLFSIVLLTFLVMVLPRLWSGTIVHFISKVVLVVLGLSVVSSGTCDASCPIIVSNHVGMIDILILLSQSPMSFVADNGIRRFSLIGPFWGIMAERIGCIFVSRESESSRIAAKEELHRRARTEKNLASLCIFPEGTTSNGSGILPFKQGAFEPLVPVQAVLLEYERKEWGYCSVWSDVYFAYIMALPASRVKVSWYPKQAPSESESVAEFCNRVRQTMLTNSSMKDFVNHKNPARNHNQVCSILEAKYSS